MSARRNPLLREVALGFISLVIFLESARAIDTGCPGDGTNSSVAVEYIFYEGSGTNAFNSGADGTAADAHLTNGVVFSTDVPPANVNCGYSISLPSTGSGSTTPAVEASNAYDPLAGATNFTIMAWVKRLSSSTNNNQSARIVSDTSSVTLTNTTSGFEFRFSGAAGTLALRVNGNELVTTVGGIAPNEGNWHHVAVVYDGSLPATNGLTRHAHFYVDAVQRGLGVSNATLEVTVATNSNPLTIGNSSVSRGVNNLLVGKMDDVRILRGFAPEAVGNGNTNATILCYMNSKDDFEPPTITCPGNVITNADMGVCYASGVELGTPTTSDNCITTTVTNNAPTIFPVGLTYVVWTASDLNGNSSVCTQQVTVVEHQAPTITCPTAVVTNSTGGCNATGVVLGTPTTSDNCMVASVTNNAPTSFPPGTNIVTWTVYDTSGNSNSCLQYVIVFDNHTFSITCPPTVTVNTDEGQLYRFRGHAGNAGGLRVV